MKYYQIKDNETGEYYDTLGLDYSPVVGTIIEARKQGVPVTVKILGYNDTTDIHLDTDGILFVMKHKGISEVAEKLTKIVNEPPAQYIKAVCFQRIRGHGDMVFESVETRNTIDILPGTFFKSEEVIEFMHDHPDVDCYFINWEKI